MDLGSDKPDPEVYPDGIHLETVQDLGVTRYVGTCGWCSLWGDQLFRVVSENKGFVVRAFNDHAKIHHPGRLDPKFNARTVG